MNNDVSKKRKKTSKEKRVLVASLGIAAVVAAGSTFAWFTSQDEVTNRLSANAAYDVSVIETFTPPTNWIPGQKVNKDTAAVNTGNIPAFVKQKLSGKMQVTLQQAEKTFNIDALNAENANPDTTKKKKYVELSEDEVDVIEAGGYLAWASNGDTPIGIKKGEELTDETKQCYLGEVSAVHSGISLDEMDPKTNDFYSDLQFAPPATGDYIFRRVIDVAADGTETYEYKGYHFEAGTGKYYEIKVINGVLPEENGILTAAPTVYYGVEVTDRTNLPLRYEPADTRNYLLFQPTNTSNVIKKQYLESETVEGDYHDKYIRYMVDNGNGEFTTRYYVCIEESGDPRSGAKVGTIYTALPDEGAIGTVTVKYDEAGKIIRDKFDQEIKTPDRLVATYEVGKSDDVFIGDPTALSDFTADNYDSKIRKIAKSDKIIAEAKYKNEKGKYEINKNAYDASTALLTALAKNEKILADKQSKVDDAIAAFTGTISKLEFSAPANTLTKFTTGANTINSAFGVVSDSQLPKVKTFIEKVAAYKKDPTTAKWSDVVTAYAAVRDAFTAGNTALETFEKDIVIAWNEAALDEGLDQVIKISDLGEYTTPANASPESQAIKDGAVKLINWEKDISAYQQAVNKYFASLSDVQSDAKYKLQDLRPLEKAYEDALNATAVKWVTNETRSGDDQTGLASTIVQGGSYAVDDAYKISANESAVTAVGLNAEKAVPIKNSISDDGYAGTAIADITGTNQFKIGDKVIANLYNDDGTLKQYDELVPDEVEAKNAAEADYNAKKAVYDRYETEHTNQDVNDDIVIYINLANIGNGSEVDQWKLSPTLVPGAEEANFYYTSVLGGGETSSILVDSVELSGDTTNVAFKEFDFDLNVTIDSAQVVVSEDGRFYESTAVNANDQFIAKPSEPKYAKEPAKQSVKDNVKVDWN